jgi:hypothetical protein
MTATPALKPPKRHFMSPDDNSTSSPDKLVKRPPSSRSLKFNTPMKNENAAHGLSSGDDILDILPDNLLHSVCPFFYYMKENLRSFICFGNNRSDDFKYSYISRRLLFLCNGLNLIYVLPAD